MRMKVIVLILLSSVITSCANRYQEVIITPTEEELAAQEKVLRSFFLGQDKQEVLKLTTLLNHHFFEVMENHHTYSFSTIYNAKTNMTFGLYFEDDKLVSFLSDDDSNRLFSCRTMFNTNGYHWLAFGIAPYSYWITSRDQLKGGMDYRAFNTRIHREQSDLAHAFETAINLIGYSPFIILASPMMLYEALSDEKDKNKDRDNTAILPTMKIGDSESYLLNKLGPPDVINRVNGSKVFTYNSQSYSFGLNGGQVVWRESYSMFELYNRQKEYGTYGDEDCGTLGEFWQSKTPSTPID